MFKDHSGLGVDPTATLAQEEEVWDSLKSKCAQKNMPVSRHEPVPASSRIIEDPPVATADSHSQ